MNANFFLTSIAENFTRVGHSFGSCFLGPGTHFIFILVESVAAKNMALENRQWGNLHQLSAGREIIDMFRPPGCRWAACFVRNCYSATCFTDVRIPTRTITRRQRPLCQVDNHTVVTTPITLSEACIMNYRETNRFGPQTSLGMDPRLERVLAYAFFWVSGIILFFWRRKIARCAGTRRSQWSHLACYSC